MKIHLTKTLGISLLAVCIYFLVYYSINKEFAAFSSLVLMVSVIGIYALSPNRNVKNAVSLLGHTKIIIFCLLALLVSLPSSTNYLLIALNAISNVTFFIAIGFLAAKLFRWEGWQ